ncbi:ABC transporter ATP-binding protein [Desulfosoma caldarium]|uniref:ABC transporter ATP-binding protein n=1 Tax=Desulfosoma caldarium TaxID=610254 RepID=UPI000F46481C|nr:ATP-binding cassette domain-containing protein [Desulfosoma caldarium]
MIEIVDLKKNYRKVQALKGISLRVGSGELFAYLGPNGAGKTTTIRILTGLTRPSGGQAYVGGHDVGKEPIKAKRHQGLVPQHVNLDAELTVEENLFIHGRLHGMGRVDIGRRIEELLDYVGLKEKRTSLVKRLSGGMKRRLMIARALLHRPAVLFLDEPTVGLDPAIRRRVWTLIKKIQRDGVTIFLTTHYIEEAEFLADRVAFIDEGAIVALDTPRHLMDALGQWAIDCYRGNEMETRYFTDRESARRYAEERMNGYTLRRVNLEDAFLACTGKKVS